MRAFRIPQVMVALCAAALVGCDQRAAQTTVAIEADSDLDRPLEASDPGTPPPENGENTSEAEAKAAVEQAVAIVEQLGGTVSRDLNSLDMPIIKVDLHGCPVNDKGLRAVSVLKSLEELDIRGCSELTDEGFTHLSSLTGLKKLEASNIQRLGEPGLGHLSRMATLERLNVALGHGVTNAGLKQIARLTNLRELDLASVGGITDDGLASLQPLTKLRWLNLYNAPITDAGLEHLKGMTELETLWLNGTSVTDEGVRQLQDALPKLQMVHR